MASEQAEHAQQHPIRIYLIIWGLLFVLSVFSYLVDYAGFEGLLKWTLITLFMLLKAGLIVAVFMHMIWERLAIICAVLIPPGVLLVLMALMALEANYTLFTRLRFFLQ
ncbi:cytochrome C oxidase subunit IV family protein [Spiribacter halobius]|uniref:Cytochrome C oxidase subunit IV n=1 Tax=Sediminicurvatus halobius TaxID=2182432 RepID=A0A2U2N5Z1_9GAMM|nr:cytochrome C oxidase subunit IV family protein [Spiribacter halobius]PWG64645.1 cytochrome C oxidase subunit IV [Spiribacter halobius]UEX79030.1 cytochrome C oxidase subunit IV family protein [Spiribacter halobius]